MCSVRLNPVVLPDGTKLDFEVRFGDHAVSERMPEPPATRMVQVSQINESAS
jgi:hypothetical protein